MRQDGRPVVMNFTGIYEKETFYRSEKICWIDCRDIHGTNCYCDEQAEQILEERIRKLPPEGIHFIDSGNYHYMTKLWTDKIREPFVLILIDHHPDAQPSLFENLLSCGCWAARVLDENPHVRKIVLLGAEEELVKVFRKIQDRIAAYNEEAVVHDRIWEEFRKKHIEVPVYAYDRQGYSGSLRMVKTNWNQGK